MLKQTMKKNQNLKYGKAFMCSHCKGYKGNDTQL